MRNIRFLPEKRALLRYLIVLFVTATIVHPLLAQEREYVFNAPGNPCYFEYLCYTQNNDYLTIKRPFIFVLGKVGQPLTEVYRNDSLKNLPSFGNYMFVYLPNQGGNSKNKLRCIEPLASLLTQTYKYGNTNLFLTVNDPEITREDVAKYGMNATFKSIRLSEATPDTSVASEATTVTEEFKETLIYEEPVVEEPESGTYYIEESKAEAGVESHKEATKKVYFGAPTMRNFTLTGIVRDISSSEALPFANIQVKGTTVGASANADGYFTLLKVPTDTSVIVIQYVGYEKTELFLTPQTPKRNLKIDLKSSTQNLEAVTVYGQKEDVMLSNKTDVSLIKVTPKEISKLPSLGEKDVLRSFQLMPGVSASNESSSGLYIRGGTPDQNLVLYDGFTVYHVDHLYGFYSAFNSNAVKDVQLYKGGFESKFGGRLSSVTEITGKDGNQKKFNLGVDLSLLSVNAFVEVPIGSKFSSVIAYRRSYKGLIYNTIFEKFNKSTNTSITIPEGGGGKRMSQDTKITSYFYDLNGKFTFRPTSVDVVSLSLFNGSDILDNSSETESSSFGAGGGGMNMNSTDLTEYGNISGSLKWARKWSDKLFGNTVISYSNYFSDRNRSQERTSTDDNGDTTTTSNGIFENNNLKDYSLKSDYQWDLFHFCQLQFGGFATRFDIKYTYAQNDTSTVLDRKSNATLAGGYLQSQFKLFKDKLQIIPGVRTSWFETTKQMYYEPRASLNLSLTKKLTLKGAWGKYYQFANRVTREDIISGSKDFWLLSDGSNVPVSSSIHYVVGLSYENSNYLFSAETYYKELANLTEYSLRINPNPMGVNYNENFFNGYGFSKGVELLMQKKSGKINGWISYTFGQAQNHFDVYSDTYYPANQDVTHEFKAVVMYQYKRWDFAATWVFATGRPYTAPSGAYTVTLLDGTTQDFFTVTAKNGLRLPDYHRCDLSAAYKILLGSKGDKKRRDIGSIGLSIFNVYNRENVWYKQFTIVDGSILETNVKYLGITPNLTLSLKIR